MVPKDDSEALRDYQEAYKKYDEMMEEYFPLKDVVIGKGMKLTEPMTVDAFNELSRLHDDMETKHEIWMEFMRK